MDLTHSKGKSVVTEGFIRTLTKLTSILLWYQNETVDKYNKIYHETIK